MDYAKNIEELTDTQLFNQLRKNLKFKISQAQVEGRADVERELELTLQHVEDGVTRLSMGLMMMHGLPVTNIDLEDDEDVQRIKKDLERIKDDK